MPAWHLDGTGCAQWLRGVLLRCLLLAVCAAPPLAAAAQNADPANPMPVAAMGGVAAVRLSDATPQVQAWPAVRVLYEDADALGLQGPLSLRQVMARDAQFQVPDGRWANLGSRRHVVWLRIPVQVDGGDGRWILDFDYPALNQVDVSLLTDGQLVQQQRIGAMLKLSEQPMPSRTPALALMLQPGQQHLLYVRVQTQSALVLPVRFSQPRAFQTGEAQRLAIQCGLTGFALALLAYCLAHGLSMRDPLFGFYSLMLLGTTLFFVHMNGLGQLFLWPEHPGLQALLSPLAVLLALAPAALFVAGALDTRRLHPRLHRVLLGLSALSAVCLVAGALGLLPYAVLKAVASGAGLPLTAIASWVALQSLRRGNSAAAYMLVGWAAYTVGGTSIVAMLYGWLPATSWTLHLFQACWLLEILAWLQVLALHIEGVRRHAERAELEKEALQSLAHTDALTGLPNRRGLALALEQSLQASRAEQPLAVYMLDLDGFKPINDRLGHDAGDALLVQVAQRLREQLRAGDVVARLGGDEFVVLAQNLGQEADAIAVGHKLLRAFEAPFVVGGQFCQVGLTIGLALAPQDGRQAVALLKVADAAMYAGKQGGRHCLRRGQAGAAWAAG